MLRAPTLQAYRAAPVNRFLRGPTYAVWCLNEALSGCALWGRLEESHLADLLPALDARLAVGVSPHSSLVDARHVDGIAPAALEQFCDYLSTRAGSFARFVRRQAVLKPGGIAGAVVSGVCALLAPAYPVQVFAGAREAFDWLGVGEAEPVLAELSEIRVGAASGSSLLRELRAQLAADLGTSLQAAALKLGVSPRTLQRKLSEAQTNFQSELSLARVRAARALMLETDFGLKRVAFEVGCASPQQFSTLFRRCVGETPTQWRNRTRADGAH